MDISNIDRKINPKKIKLWKHKKKKPTPMKKLIMV